MDLKLKLFDGAISIIYHELGRPGQSNLEDNGGMLPMQCKHWLVSCDQPWLATSGYHLS